MVLSNNIGGASGSAIGSAISTVNGFGRQVASYSMGSGMQRNGINATMNIDATTLSRVGEFAGRALIGGQIGSTIGSYVGGILGNALNSPFSPIHGPGWNAQVGGGPGGPGNPQATASPQSPSAPGIPGLTQQQNQQLMQALASKMLDQQKAGKEATKDGKVDTSKLDKRVVDEIKKYAEQFKEMKKEFFENIEKLKKSVHGNEKIEGETKVDFVKEIEDARSAAETNLDPDSKDFAPKAYSKEIQDIKDFIKDNKLEDKLSQEDKATLEKMYKVDDEIAKPMQSLAERNQGAALKMRDQLKKDVDKIASKDSFKADDNDDDTTKTYKSSAKALTEATKAHEEKPTKENETKLSEAREAFAKATKEAGKTEEKDAKSLMRASDLYDKTDDIAKQGKEISEEQAKGTSKDIFEYLTEEHKDDGKDILKTISEGAADADKLIEADKKKAEEATQKAEMDTNNSTARLDDQKLFVDDYDSDIESIFGDLETELA